MQTFSSNNLVVLCFMCYTRQTDLLKATHWSSFLRMSTQLKFSAGETHLFPLMNPGVWCTWSELWNSSKTHTLLWRLEKWVLKCFINPNNTFWWWCLSSQSSVGAAVSATSPRTVSQTTGTTVTSVTVSKVSCAKPKGSDRPGCLQQCYTNTQVYA